MIIKILKSKIHNANITNHNVDYDGSIGIDENLIDAAKLCEFEKVHVLNIDNGERIETYVIKEERGSGNICIYGAAAHLIQKGQRVIVLAYGSLAVNDIASYKPSILYLNSNNSIKD